VFDSRPRPTSISPVFSSAIELLPSADGSPSRLTIETASGAAFPSSSHYTEDDTDAARLSGRPQPVSPTALQEVRASRSHQPLAGHSFFSSDYDYSYSDDDSEFESGAAAPSISTTAFELFANAPRPLPVLPTFDDRPLLAIFAAHWREFRLSPPGDPGVILFRFFASQPGLDSPAMELKIVEFLDRRKLEFARNELEGGFRFFAAVHKFAALLDRNALRPAFLFDLKQKISELLPWLISLFVPSLITDFRICTRCAQTTPVFGPAFERIIAAKQGLVLKFGAFLWTRVQHAVDCELANQLVVDYQYGTMEEIREGLELVLAFSRKLRSQMPVFSQAMNFVMEYQEIIAKKIQFEEKARNLTPKFLLGLVFAAKRKGIIPLEVSDQRILTWALYLKVDVTTVDGKMIADESKTEVPFSLWD
jgi:hypothetical protein